MSRWPFIVGAVVVGCLVALAAKLVRLIDEPWARHVGRWDT